MSVPLTKQLRDKFSAPTEYEVKNRRITALKEYRRTCTAVARLVFDRAETGYSNTFMLNNLTIRRDDLMRKYQFTDEELK